MPGQGLPHLSKGVRDILVTEVPLEFLTGLRQHGYLLTSGTGKLIRGRWLRQAAQYSQRSRLLGAP